MGGPAVNPGGPGVGKGHRSASAFAFSKVLYRSISLPLGTSNENVTSKGTTVVLKGLL